jgi:hypothetical protein
MVGYRCVQGIGSARVQIFLNRTDDLRSLAFHAKAQTAGAREQINGTHFDAVSLHLTMRPRQDITDALAAFCRDGED